MKISMPKLRRARPDGAHDQDRVVTEKPTTTTPVASLPTACLSRRVAAFYGGLTALLALLALAGKAIVYDYQAIRILLQTFHHLHGH